MLHSLESLESCTYNGTDVTVLQRQAARLKWQLQQNYVVQDNSSVPQFQGLIGSNLGTGQMVELKRPDIYLGSDDFQEFVNFPVAGPEFGDSEKLDLVPPEASAAAATDYCISRTSSCQLTALHSAVMKEETEDMILEKMESTTGSGRGSFNKRKAEAVADHKNKDKRIKGEVEGESEVKTKCSTEISGISSKGNSKASEVQKPDYIHVRARRGQATDSHSLAERARREKISKKMKCLQDLVPGCDKITGKAGMLDEIINYVQSLQRQVEFLSMKIAALHPNVEFNVENIPMKEFPALVANFPAAAKLPAMACFQLNQLQKEAVNCMFNETMHHPQTASEGIANASISISEQALSSSSMTQLQPFSTWNTDPQCLYNAYNMGFH